ncbi:MAG: endonuclease NucS domain-containing protein [Terracidiphilus sp.]
MEAPKRYLVIIEEEGGKVTSHAMKQWLREHPPFIPPGMSPDENNSRQLKRGLRNTGWRIQETDSEVRFFPPSTAPLPGAAPVEDESEDEGSSMDAEEVLEFSLEKHLQQFIAGNLPSLLIAGKCLRLYRDSANQVGVEYPTATGPVDILAVDDVGNFYVLELKLSHGPDKAMGQLTRYMGWVRQHLANGREVYGVIVAKNMSERLRYAALAVPGVTLLEYEVRFKLKDAGFTVGAGA